MTIFNSFFNSSTELMQIAEDLLHLNFKFLSLGFSVILQLLPFVVFLLIVNVLLIKLVLRFVPSGNPSKLNIAFFHPYCNAGGGGERVLWTAVKSIQQRYPEAECYIYTGDKDATPEQIKDNCFRRFHITLPRDPHFIYLNLRCLVEAKSYPVFTLLMQSLGSVFLGAEALGKFRPEVYVDSMGYAFTYPLFRFLGNCYVASYTHYPTISSDMLQRVSDRTEAHNNRAFVSRSFILSILKLVYYNLFAFIYGLVGSCAHVVMVNSTWTKNHISSLWLFGASAQTVFPPCNADQFTCLSLIRDNEKELKTIVSIGQFRPEKDYPMQLRIFKKLLDSVEEDIARKLRLVLIGGVRNLEDEQRVEDLKALSAELNVENQVIWKVNASFSELLQEIQKGTFGIHTMWNEHFGIGIVECMAGGLVVIAHDSGGPKLDIVTPYEGKITGYLASTEEAYVQTIKQVLSLSSEERLTIRETARSSTNRFNDEVFERDFLASLQPILNRHRND